MTEDSAEGPETVGRRYVGIMGRLGMSGDPIKQAVVWAFEKVARLKPAPDEVH